MAIVQTAQQSAVLSLFLLPEMMTIWVETNYQLKGEKKIPKKCEERKRFMTVKMQKTFADLEGTFTEKDLDVKGIGEPGSSLSMMALSKLENLPLPDLLNLPQDLRELKRKIEATEHEVEGTKHRHRKGGPCPRCQVQNELRAAKRAYHKRAVTHKKLPHIVRLQNAQAAAAATLELAGSVTAAIKVSTGADARKESNASLASVSGNSFRAVFSGVANISTGMLKHVQRSTTSSVSSPSGSLCSTSSMITTGTIGSTSGSSSTSSWWLLATASFIWYTRATPCSRFMCKNLTVCSTNIVTLVVISLFIF
ncbi:hypothetical protein PsorP6_012173 [Peronosclerospora sorghi]|uniref:Uncharacterized protein n=1 Tax=Peronosclerospora sorghi TaxID=230839 RepID=A0ACC0WJ18_9STRA|nr:hypothetical protein PsorP6_012173 [Peronosclerospora sorghi]